MKIISIVLGLFFASVSFSYAYGDFNSNGCPPGTYSVVLSPDQQVLSVLFDSFNVEAGGNTGRLQDTKTCRLQIPINVPAGHRIGVYKVDYRGYVNIPHKGRSHLMVDYIFANQKSPTFHKQMMGARNQEYILTDTIGAGHMKWTACGMPTIIDLKATLSLALNGEAAQSMITFDSLDGQPKGGITYHLQLKRCSN
ncbi:MAG: DUF4360 domain-containing protein [Oligoflexia bacterium]|nr:DUF4360 domain-containing protein [Oligoflexia bacterium]